MNTRILYFIPVLLLMFTMGCQVDEYEQVEDQVNRSKSQPVFTMVDQDYARGRLDGNGLCGDMVVKPLFSLPGKQSVGYISYGNDQENLYVNFSTEDDWYIRRIFLYVGPESEMPENHWGFPKTGLFNHNKHFKELTQDQTYTIPLEELGGDCVTISAFVIVNKRVHWRHHSFYRSAIASAFGNHPVGNSWHSGWANGWKNEYCIQDCEVVPPVMVGCGQAWAEGNSFNYDENTGFFDIISINPNDYYWKTLYAEIPSDDATAGIPVGQVRILYNGALPRYELGVTITVDEGYQLQDAQLFVNTGAGPLVSPEEFTFNKTAANPSMIEFTIKETGVRELTDLYIAVSATVCGQSVALP